MKARFAFDHGADLVEFRIDLLRSARFEEIKAELSEFSERAVLTVRSRSEGGGFKGSETERVGLIRRLSALNPAFFDVELRTLEEDSALAATKLGRTTIASWHDLEGTLSGTRLLSIMKREEAFGLPKIVTTARTATDALAVLSLYDKGVRLIAFCMGKNGIFSRVMAIERGSPIIYASLPGEPTASGQFALGQAVALRRRLDVD